MASPQPMIILYCSEQSRSSRFFEQLLGQKPLLEVPGMTEFILDGNVLLGLMPYEGAHKLLGNTLPHPAQGKGIPSCEIYLPIEDAEHAVICAVKNGAILLSPLAERNWGHKAAYLSDPDGHIIGIAEKNFKPDHIL
jgi:lactoylglutathione lyase